MAPKSKDAKHAHVPAAKRPKVDASPTPAAKVLAADLVQTLEKENAPVKENVPANLSGVVPPKVPESFTSVEPSRIQRVVKVKMALKDQKYFQGIPPKVCDMVANVAQECLSLELEARHALQLQMLGVVDETFTTAHKQIAGELAQRKDFMATAEPKKQELENALALKKAALEAKKVEVQGALESQKVATEHLTAAKATVEQAVLASALARKEKDTGEKEAQQLKKTYDDFIALDGTSPEQAKAGVPALVPQLKSMKIEDSQIDSLPAILGKPDGERSSLELTSIVIIEGTFAKHMRTHTTSVAKAEDALKQKEGEEAAAKQEAEKLSESLAVRGEELKSREAEQKVCEQDITSASSELADHEKAMSTGETKVQQQQALLDGFEEILSIYTSLKNATPTAEPAAVSS